MSVTESSQKPRLYVPEPRDWLAEAEREWERLCRAHGPRVANALMDGRPSVLDKAAAVLWALSPLTLRRALLLSLAQVAAWAALVAWSPEVQDLVTSPVALSPLETRAGPAGWLGS